MSLHWIVKRSNIDKIYNQNNVPDVILFRNQADYFHIIENKVLNESIKHTHTYEMICTANWWWCLKYIKCTHLHIYLNNILYQYMNKDKRKEV